MNLLKIKNVPYSLYCLEFDIKFLYMLYIF